MRITALRTMSASPYQTKAQIAEALNISPKTVQVRAKEIDAEVAGGRYGEYAVIRDGGIVLINYLVFVDYMKHRQMLRQKNCRKHVPPFDAAKVAHDIGWYADKEAI